MNLFLSEWVSNGAILVFRATLVLDLVAGLYQTGEAWYTNRNIHISSINGTDVKLHKHWEYVYNVAIVLATNGYGDIIPHTILGRIIICTVFFLFLPFYIITTSKMVDYLKNFFIRLQVQAFKFNKKSAFPRIIITGSIK